MALASLKSLSWFILIGSIDLKIIVLLLLSWTVAHQAPLSMEFSRQEYWSGQPFPFPRDPPDSGIEPWSSALQADSLPCEPPEKPISMKKKKLQMSANNIPGSVLCTLHALWVLLLLSFYSWKELMLWEVKWLIQGPQGSLR